MQKQALVVGLGQFGMSLARALSQRGVEVLCVDTREERVRAAAPFVTEALHFDATEEAALGRTSPERRDVCISAIGDESRDASFICTALLLQMGAKRVIARASDDLHARILALIGAHRIVNPERDFGDRFASQIVHEEVRGEMPLGDDLRITEAEASESFVGQTLSDLQLAQRYGVTVIAVRKPNRDAVVLPDEVATVEPGDVFVMVAKEGAVAKMIEGS